VNTHVSIQNAYIFSIVLIILSDRLLEIVLLSQKDTKHFKV
jgi:hypothetical protein